MSSGKLQMELVMVMVLAMMCSMLITPSLAQNVTDQGEPLCWQSITNCMSENINHASDPILNSSSALLNLQAALCCPLIQQVAQTQKSCFCLIDPVIHLDPTGPVGGNVTLALNVCNVAKDLPAFDAFCLGANLGPAAAPMPLSADGVGASSLSTFTTATEAAVTQRSSSKPASPPTSDAANMMSLTALLISFVVLSTAFLFY